MQEAEDANCRWRLSKNPQSASDNRIAPRIWMSVSIVIPTYNEADVIGPTIRSLREQPECEIIVVDGGSGDATVAEAREADCVLSSPPGRAVQMNTGAARARGDALLFLHADCRLGPGAVAAIEHALARRQVMAGCFSMRVAAEGWGFRCIDACATARVRLTGIVYGDQGFFLRRHDFARLGGFLAVRFMEDVMFSRTVAKQGNVIVLPQRIYVSPRRWQKVGLVRQTLRNWTLTALALSGVSPDRLASYYPHVR
jgi:rSAM/selenodomain-associated transferase 2